jgi:hypothetical protein
VSIHSNGSPLRARNVRKLWSAGEEKRSTNTQSTDSDKCRECRLSNRSHDKNFEASIGPVSPGRAGTNITHMAELCFATTVQDGANELL